MFGKSVEQLTVGDAGQAVSANWSYEWRMTQTPARNVVAILPGSDPTRAAEYVLVGGVAMGLHGLVRATQDVDLFVRPEADNVARVKAALRAVWDDPAIDECAASTTFAG